MSKRLSILICGIKSRESLLMNLAKTLKHQGNNSVEILASIDSGESPIGRKRNELLDNSKGDYVCFVDDDDQVSPFYISRILKAVETNPDCVGIEGIIVQKGIGPRKFIHSLRYNDWYEDNNVYYRCPNHLNPIKREIAMGIKFPEISYHEDRDFSIRLKDHLKTEEYIEDPIYFYYPSN